MQTIRLSSGRDVVIRPIRPDDGSRLQAAHDNVAVHRFCAGLSAGLSSRRFGTIEEVELELAS